MREKHFLIIAASIGSGHIKAAEAVADALKIKYPDAQINTERGVVVTNQTVDPFIHVDGFDSLFGPASYHNGDYGFYYYNIRDNVAKRISSFLLKDRKYKVKTGK